MFSFLAQFVNFWMPGRNSNIVQICLGEFSVTKLPVEEKIKFNFSVYALLLVTIVIHVVVGLKLRRARKMTAPQVSVAQNCTCNTYLVDAMLLKK
jgi:hypothetical protein